MRAIAEVTGMVKIADIMIRRMAQVPAISPFGKIRTMSSGTVVPNRIAAANPKAMYRKQHKTMVMTDTLHQSDLSESGRKQHVRFKQAHSSTTTSASSDTVGI